MYFESSSYVSSSDGQFHDTCWPKTNSSSPYTLEWVKNMVQRLVGLTI